eukprot:c20787_g10_i14.p2 GENE.c20787_g10_i14~~c20787_g10_i14.p2  ORF type:complete len:160 (-),score=42.80 c20787_g10_i14:124-603(-)
MLCAWRCLFVACDQQAISKCFAKQDLSTIFFERHIHTRTPQHMFIQAIGVPERLAAQAAELFQSEARKANFELVEEPHDVPLEETMQGQQPYFVVEIGTTRLVHRIGQERHPLQFGRRVIAVLLGAPEKEDWKACDIGPDGETAMKDHFREIFSEFDIM